MDIYKRGIRKKNIEKYFFRSERRKGGENLFLLKNILLVKPCITDITRPTFYYTPPSNIC